MRIISGKYKGRRIIAPKTIPARPTTDQAKESLFNILRNQYDLSELSILDLFAGIGSISLEFMSRGAINITAVDQNYASIKFINKTARDFNEEIHTFKSEVFKFLSKNKQTYDIIFADPPYEFTDSQFLKIRDLVFKNELLNEEGVLVIEHSKQTDLSAIDNFTEARHYGSSVFSFFKPTQNSN